MDHRLCFASPWYVAAKGGAAAPRTAGRGGCGACGAAGGAQPRRLRVCSARRCAIACATSSSNGAERGEANGERGAAAATFAAQSRSELRHQRAEKLKEVHRSIRDELKQTDRLAVKVAVPYDVWKPLGLSPKLKLVRVFVRRESTSSLPLFQRAIRDQMVRLFPTLSEAHGEFNLLPNGASFTLRLSSGGARHDDDTNTLRSDEQLHAALNTAAATGQHLTLTLVPWRVPRRRERERVPRPNALQAAALQPCSTHTVLSFYVFRDVDDVEFVVSRLKKMLPALGVLGRIYIAAEGVNAQLSVPTSMFDFLRIALRAAPPEASSSPCGGHDAGVAEKVAQWAAEWMPVEVLGARLNVDREVPTVDAPFVDLRVKARPQVLADGLEKALDWQRNGVAVSAEQWHNTMSDELDEVIMLDCRNKYETEVGRFETARALDTDTFRESWRWLEDELRDTDRNQRIMTYCTGGIRCVKVGAYLEQRMGFKQVERLEGGVVAYSRYLRENPQLASKFRGVNYVFDMRLGERVTNDVLTKCASCGAPCDTQTDCANDRCSRPFATRHFVQCSDCAARMLGCCSAECRDAVMRAQRSTPRAAVAGGDAGDDPAFAPASRPGGDDSALAYAYAEEYSSSDGYLLREVIDATQRFFPQRARMICGPTVGRLLAMLTKLMACRRVLEIGTFTGYSTLQFASALPAEGVVLTCDIDAEAVQLAREFFARSERAARIDSRLSSAVDLLRQLHERAEAPFDLVFIDANKAQYIDYYNSLFELGLVRSGSVIVCDNVLFKGHVPYYHDDSASDTPLAELLRRRRTHSLHEASKLAQKLQSFNEHVAADARTEQLMLPLRDGVTIIRCL